MLVELTFSPHFDLVVSARAGVYMVPRGASILAHDEAGVVLHCAEVHDHAWEVLHWDVREHVQALGVRRHPKLAP